MQAFSAAAALLQFVSSEKKNGSVTTLPLMGRDVALGGLWTGIRPQQISIASKMVKDFTGVMLQPHKVGASSKPENSEQMSNFEGQTSNFRKSRPVSSILGV